MVIYNGISLTRKLRGGFMGVLTRQAIHIFEYERKILRKYVLADIRHHEQRSNTDVKKLTKLYELKNKLVADPEMIS